MDELLDACSRANHVLSSRTSHGTIGRLLKKDPVLREHTRAIAENLHVATEVFAPRLSPHASPLRVAGPLRAVAWNIERGKNFAGILHVLQNHPQLKTADLIFLTEVDWGMARSGNRNVPRELGEALGYYAYFAPSYYNFTLGHGSERSVSGKNAFGLHGKAILSRLRLDALQAIGMPNATDKLRAAEARLGEKRALFGRLDCGGKTVTVGCVHLDAFSSPAARARQMRAATLACGESNHVLLAGDFNTNTLDSTSTPRLFFDLLKKVMEPGPQALVRNHFPYPDRRYDLPLFKTLRDFGFDLESCNEAGKGTYDLFANDRELGQMAGDQFPRWLLKWINKLIKKSDGPIGLKLDWFAAKNLRCRERQVIRIDSDDSPGLGRASDHHPIYLEFKP